MNFKPEIFEKLLFPLSNSAYNKIHQEITAIERKLPGQLKEVLSLYEQEFESNMGSTTANPEMRKFPTIDISIVYFEDDLKMTKIKKTSNFNVEYKYRAVEGEKYTSSDFIVGFKKKGIYNCFIVPLAYLLGFNEKQVMAKNSFQIYQHSIHSKDVLDKSILDSRSKKQLQKKLNEQSKDTCYSYIGITKRTWQKRFSEHMYASQRGSHLLFHRALRGEYCKQGAIEHIIYKAGLTENEALDFEEADVESQTLHPKHERGLNMIPGGRAGLKFISTWAKRTNTPLKEKINPEEVESILVDLQEKSICRLSESESMNFKNKKLAKLWAKDMEFRIKATTNQGNRFSFRQIQAARIWFASGWDKEKILDNLLRMDEKKLNMDQVNNLLSGKTYKEIPDLIL